MSVRTLAGKFSAIPLEGAMCAATVQGQLYVGTAPSGIVYRTRDAAAWEEFWETGERVVTAVGEYANALFVGTGPEGKILMHNFSTGNRFHYVNTGDYEIASFAEYNDKLYVLTSPSGMILSFDGDVWRKEYEAFMAGTALVPNGTKLHAVFSDGFAILTLSDGQWSFESGEDGPLSVAAAKAVVTSLPALDRNDLFDYGISHAAVFGGKLYFAGSRRPVLYVLDGGEISVAAQFAEGPISGIQVAGSQIFVASGDLVYYYEDELLQESSEESSTESSGESADVGQ